MDKDFHLRLSHGNPDFSVNDPVIEPTMSSLALSLINQSTHHEHFIGTNY